MGTLRTKMEQDLALRGISARTAIETGEVFFCKLGGWRDKWHYIAVGDPFYRIGEAYQKAGIGSALVERTVRSGEHPTAKSAQKIVK